MLKYGKNIRGKAGQILNRHSDSILHLFLLCVVVLSIFLCMLPEMVNAKDLKEKDLYATYCAVIDSRTGRLLFGKEQDVQVAMASTTKILTCILILENGQLEDFAYTSGYAASMPKVRMGAREGEYYKVEDLLYALMLESYNDAAVILAEYLSADVETFATLMNDKAEEIGCENYNFITPNGLDASNETGQHSITARDLTKIMTYCTTISPYREEFIRITTQTSHIVEAYEKSGEEYIKNGHRKNCLNRNALLTNENVISGKTGFTNKAGYCYVCQVELNGHPVSFAVLACGWPNNKNYKWSDSNKIMQYIEENYRERTVYFPTVPQNDYPKLVNASKQIGVLNTECPEIALAYEYETYFLSEEDEINYIFSMDELIVAPLPEGTIVGTLSVYVNEEQIESIPLYLKAKIDENTFMDCLSQVLNSFIGKVINIRLFY